MGHCKTYPPDSPPPPPFGPLGWIKLTVDEDPASYKRWISRKEKNIKNQKLEFSKSKDFCKADQENVYCLILS